jgi:major membrane immunogen (membrane-anchored lipoprotein)
MPKPLQLLCVLVISYLLSACGGGGGSEANGAERGQSAQAPGNGSLGLSWYMPDSRTDGSDLEAYEIDGYQIYYTNQDIPVEQGEVVTVRGAQTTDHTLSNLPSGTYRLAVATMDSRGIRSFLSGTITATIP